MPMMSQVPLEGLISPFNCLIWTIIIALFIASSIAILFFEIQVEGVLGLFGLLLGTPQARQPTDMGHRIFFITWAIVGYLLTQYYTAFLASKLMHGSDYKLESVEQLSKSGLKIITAQVNSFLFEPKTSANDNEVDRFFQKNIKYVNISTYLQNIRDLMAGKIKDTAIMKPRNFSVDDFSSYRSFYVLPETIHFAFRTFAMIRGLPQVERINKLIVNLRDKGLVKQIINNFKSMSKNKPPNIEKENY